MHLGCPYSKFGEKQVNLIDFRKFYENILEIRYNVSQYLSIGTTRKKISCYM